MHYKQLVLSGHRNGWINVIRMECLTTFRYYTNDTQSIQVDTGSLNTYTIYLFHFGYFFRRNSLVSFHCCSSLFPSHSFSFVCVCVFFFFLSRSMFSCWFGTCHHLQPIFRYVLFDQFKWARAAEAL